MKTNVIESHKGDTIRRSVRIIWKNHCGRYLYIPTSTDKVMLRIFDKDMTLIEEKECRIENDMIIADFPVFDENGQYFYEIRLEKANNERYTFIDSEIIIGRRNRK